MTEDGQTRDRARTEAAILAAAERQLAEGGFTAFGVNAIARAAGCDKQLIYRYFGGLDGLAEAIGRRLAGRGHESSPPLATSYLEFTEHVLLTYLETLRRDPLAQKIAAWELVERSPLVDRLAAARLAGLNELLSSQPTLQPPLGVDGPAINALLLGAIQQLVLAAGLRGEFAGIPLNEDRSWIRVRLALRSLVRSAYRVGRIGAEAPKG